MIDVFPKSIFCLLMLIDSPGKINQWEVLLINVFYRNKKRNLFLGKQNYLPFLESTKASSEFKIRPI